MEINYRIQQIRKKKKVLQRAIFLKEIILDKLLQKENELTNGKRNHSERNISIIEKSIIHVLRVAKLPLEINIITMLVSWHNSELIPLTIINEKKFVEDKLRKLIAKGFVQKVEINSKSFFALSQWCEDNGKLSAFTFQRFRQKT